MSKNTSFETLPKRAQDALQSALNFVRAPAAMLLLWEQVLTPSERKRLGNDPEQAFQNYRGTIGVWRKLHGGSQSRAILDIAYRLNYMDAQRRDWLLREIGERGAEKNADDVPSWDRETGQLRFRGKKIRQVRVMANPSNIVQILDAFESKFWPRSIPNPLKLGQEQLHQALRSLNKGLKRIRFRAQEGSKAISWEPA